MINDFPPLIDGEILFGYIYRYHIYSGNLHFSDTAQEIWDDINKWAYSIIFPLVANNFIKAMGMTQHEYIFKHTVLPFYKLFIDKNKYDQIVFEMFSNNRYCANRLFKGTKINIDHKSINFCPLCIEENYDLPLIKREHNIDGVYICVKHKCYLNKHCWGKERKRDIFGGDIVDKTVRYSENNLLLEIADDVLYILNHEILLDINSLRDHLNKKAMVLHYVNKDGYWKQEVGNSLRNSFNNVPKEYQQWIKYLTIQKVASERIPSYLHPICYILVIHQLYGSFENFIKENNITLLS